MEFEHQQSIKDDLEDFFTSPSKDKLLSVLSLDKEYDYIDYKEQWPDRSKIARHILGMANAGGGIIVVGVKEHDDGRLESVGMDNPLDEADFGQKVEQYTPEGTDSLYALETFRYNDVYSEAISGKVFQVLFINTAVDVAPLVAARSGSSIEEGEIYTRRNTKTEKADYDEVQAMLQRRQETEEEATAKLHEELSELKTLYKQIDQTKTKSKFSFSTNVFSALYETEKNPAYPEETFTQFIRNMIAKKKILIEKRLGVENIRLPTQEENQSG